MCVVVCVAECVAACDVACVAARAARAIGASRLEKKSSKSALTLCVLQRVLQCAMRSALLEPSA